MEHKLLLIKSNRMDKNKKKGRDENTLLRMSKTLRENLNIKVNKNLNLISNKKSVTIEPFPAFASDIGFAKAQYKDNLDSVCFVSSKTFNTLSGGVNQDVLQVTLSDLYKSMLIGTDPELLIVNDGKVVNASNIPNLTKATKFGSDGAMAELRPTPGYTPEELVANIKSILEDQELTKHIKNYDWLCACYFEDKKRDFPVGTHLHFDNPSQIAALSVEKRHRLFSVTNKIVDEFLTLPMIRLDGPSGHNRRAKCKMSQAMGYGNVYGVGYGFFGEWRDCCGRLEHRSLSGLVLSSPEICTDVFGTAQAITEAVYKDVINNGLDTDYILPKEFSKTSIYEKNFEDWEKVPLANTFGCTKSSGFMRTVMDKSSRIEIDISYIAKWLDAIRKLTTYSKYEKYIESLGALLLKNAVTLNKLDKNIKNTWGIV